MISSRAKTKQTVYTDILVTKSVKISAWRALLFAKAINKQIPISVFVYLIAVDNLSTRQHIKNRVSEF